MVFGQDSDEGSELGAGTMRGRDYPTLRQFSIFSPNKVGQLMSLLRLLEANRIRVLALAVVDTVECAIIRMLVTQPERAYEILDHNGYKFVEVDMVVIEIPVHQESHLSTIFHTLLRAESNVHYTYPVIGHMGKPALAINVDNVELAIRVLGEAGFMVLTEGSFDE